MRTNASFPGAEHNGHSRRQELRSPSRVTFLDRWLIRRLFDQLGRPPIAVVLWNGEQLGDVERPHVKVHLPNRRLLLQLAGNVDLGFGEAYSRGEIAVEGDLLDLCNVIEKSLQSKRRRGLAKARVVSKDLQAARRNIHQHYDISNEFYRLWLDDQMVYTCAYFERPEMTLEDAQTAKLHHVCRKLRLKPGQHIIEAGCGWGALALHMARHYGVRVRAYNISHEQIVFARERAQKEGLSSQVEFIEEDWRSISGECDAFVSVGMLEHVGIENFRLLGELIRKCLRPEGLGLIHTIGRNIAQPLSRWTQERIFPGANPPSFRQMMDIFEQGDFSILDVENLRLHYDRTLEHWLERFDSHEAEVREMFGEMFVRMWRLYLSASISAFRYSSLQLFQVVFSAAGNNEIPWTRADIYADREPLRNVVPKPSDRSL